MTESVGLIGVGLVGMALAKLLIARGFRVIGFDPDPARLALLESAGGRGARSPAAVADAAQRILLALMETRIAREAVERPDGVLSAQRLPTHLIDTGTGDPDEVVALGERLAACGIHLIDAPLSGSSGQIAARTAVMMVGAGPGDYAACRDLLEAIGERIFLLGGPGAGMRAKLASNLVVGLNRLVLAEGLVFAESLGLDLPAFLAMLKASPAYSAAMDVKGERMLTGRFEPEARLRQHRKDVSLMLKYGQAARQPLPLSEAHLAVLDAAIAAGDGDLDNAAVIRTLRAQRK